MNVLRNPWWWAAVLLFVLHQLLQRVLGYPLELIDSYLDPFLAPPILLGLWLWERQLVWRAPYLRWYETAVAVLVLAVIFEEVYPRYREAFRYDVWDYLAYGLGAVYFYFLINVPREDVKPGVRR
ncbi:hypothetical protein CLV84_1392 [Neolewinella xylanilytica]|uniref:Magnesium citrate secondary transporter n=1 Tax=Neolewinella xylanilytica TaxID=1514080 RepID=A0A2S6IAA2_9BACT|nr:hypothetical protein [Neolewinella xylanilytica]PPK88425.1 hypothetical protein CLV84_1392 [Neolewinella xylanilytica]